MYRYSLAKHLGHNTGIGADIQDGDDVVTGGRDIQLDFAAEQSSLVSCQIFLEMWIALSRGELWGFNIFLNISLRICFLPFPSPPLP